MCFEEKNLGLNVSNAPIGVSGIMPLAKSTKRKSFSLISQLHIIPERKGIHCGWSVPGNGVAYADCGALRFRGCLNVDEHGGALDDPGRQGKAYVQGYYRSCNRKECPKCCGSWASLEANRAVYRLLSFCVSRDLVREIYSIMDDERRSRYLERAFSHARKKVIHVIFSVPRDFYHEDISVLRASLYKIAKKCGLSGGLAIFHPFRSKDWSPHFHVLAFGWVRHVKVLYERYGWVIKNVGVRKTVFGTLIYQLSHAGVHEDHHTVTWFGSLSYNKMFVDPLPECRPVCPLCGGSLVDLVFCGSLDRPPPDKEGDYFLPLSDWKVFRRVIGYT